MPTVGDKVKESLIGAASEPQLSESNRKEFLKHAHQAEDGEYYMTEQEFINAIAPTSEDYVWTHAFLVFFFFLNFLFPAHTANGPFKHSAR
jgi:hypothetical protein